MLPAQRCLKRPSQVHSKIKDGRERDKQKAGSVVNAKDIAGPRGEICDCSEVMELASMVTEADQKAVMA
jgi:hypothetical protein